MYLMKYCGRGLKPPIRLLLPLKTLRLVNMGMAILSHTHVAGQLHQHPPALLVKM